MKTFLVFRNGKLISVVQSTENDYESAINGADYVVEDPQEAEKQIAAWREKNGR